MSTGRVGCRCSWSRCWSPPRWGRRPSSGGSSTRGSRRGGDHAAILVSSVGWASLHVQYDLYSVAGDRPDGALPGRGPPADRLAAADVILHGVANAVATVEMMVLVHLRGG